MVLVDSVYINNGGGKILLDYLVKNLEDKDIEVFYLFDERCKGSFEFVEESRKKYIKASLVQRHTFYKGNKSTFEKILCFGNLPPNIALSAEVFTYFHQPLYLGTKNKATGLNRLLFQVKSFILFSWKNNTDYFIVQSGFIRDGLSRKFRIASDRIKIIPFYPPIEVDREVERKKNSFIYVSNGDPHKNHSRLLQAFCQFHDLTGLGKLSLTIDSRFVDLSNDIKKLQEKGYPIENLGFVSRKELSVAYASAEYLIFPSLAESFGLGLIEAIELGCKVIGSDLPYTHEVCEPSLSFDPESVESILEAIKTACTSKLESSKPLIKNDISKLIAHLN